MDSSKLGEVAAKLMDSLDEDFEGEPVEMGEVMILAEIRTTHDDGETSTAIHFRCSDPRGWVQNGLLQAALDGSREV